VGSIPTALTNQFKDLSRDFRSRIEVTLVFGQQTGQQPRDFALVAGHRLDPGEGFLDPLADALAGPRAKPRAPFSQFAQKRVPCNSL
jgi:hypothetical protein